MQFYIDTLLLSLLLPLAAGAGFVFLGAAIAGPDPRSSKTRPAAWGETSEAPERSAFRELVVHILLSLAPAAAFCMVLCLLGWLKTQPERSHEWLPYVGLVAAVGAWFSNCCPAGRWLIPLEVGVVAAWFLLPRNWTFALYVQERPIWLLFLPQVILALWLTAVNISGRPGDNMLALGWLAWGGTAVVLLLLSGNARFAQMGTVVTATLAGAAGMGLFQRCSGWWSRLTPVSVVLLAGLLLQGYLFSRTDWEEWSPHDIPRLSFLLVLLAPLAAWVGELLGINRLPLRMRGLVQVLLMAAVAGLGLYTAITWPEPMTGEEWE